MARSPVLIIVGFGVTVSIAHLAHAEPIGAFGGGAGAYARMRSGFFLGADTGIATLVSSSTDSIARTQSLSSPEYHGWTYGVRIGYEWASGLAIQARVDDLGTHTGDGTEALTLATVGVRYSLPFFVMPFADALVGPAFDSSGTSLGAAIGVGASLLVTRHLGVDLAFRDWMVDLDGGIRHVPTVTVGVQIGFGR